MEIRRIPRPLHPQPSIALAARPHDWVERLVPVVAALAALAALLIIFYGKW